MESELIALELPGQEIEWLGNLLGDVSLWGSTVPVSLHCDSQVVIEIVKSYAYNGKRRHSHQIWSKERAFEEWDDLSLDYVRSEIDPLTQRLTKRVI
ncbi:UNVERIFIED_CONTAM: hypothetical protein Sradi_4430300 [Sesamum radiatum]|uniref:RNase H type-1 domain-containing protein n=1 Tax=Sesamum radiatum TaxID=300843 RepID=A0AAW2NQ63_SESRA